MADFCDPTAEVPGMGEEQTNLGARLGVQQAPSHLGGAMELLWVLGAQEAPTWTVEVQ